MPWQGCKHLAVLAPAAVFVGASGCFVYWEPHCHIKGTPVAEPSLSRIGEAGEGPPEPPPPAQQPHSGFQQGVCEPHKGNGKIVSHPEARLLPGLLAHNRTFVLHSRRTKRTGVGGGGKHFRALSNARRGGARPPEAGPTSRSPPLCKATGAGTQARLGVPS